MESVGAEPERHVLDALVRGRLNDPFAVLGPHQTAQGRAVRAFFPGALALEVRGARDGRLLGQLAPHPEYEGFFCGIVAGNSPYIFRIQWPGTVQETEDAYSFGALLSDLDLHLFSEGTHWDLASRFGANITEVSGVHGVRFAVWAPNAQRVSVVGEFNSWDGRRNPMRLRSEEHTSELQSQFHLVCRLLLEKKKKKISITLPKDVTQFLNNPKPIPLTVMSILLDLAFIVHFYILRSLREATVSGFFPASLLY